MSQKLKLITALLAAAALACTFTLPSTTRVTGSGNVVTVREAQTGFDRLDIGHAFRATIDQGDDFSVVIRIDDNLEEQLRVIKRGTTLEEQLRVMKRGTTLEIGLDPARTFSFQNVTLEVDITMPLLVGLDLSGASHATISGFESDRPMEIDVSGASTLRGDLISGNLTMDASGASTVALDGIGGDLALDASGASTVDLEEFAVADAQVGLSGASSATVNVSGILDVEASGASRLEYTGDPELGRIDTSGASSVGEK